MDKDLLALITAGGTQSGTAAGADASGVSGSSTTGRPSVPTNPLMEALTERLLKQTQGISSSSSSQLQSEIAAAMAGTERAGALTAARLQSERAREMSFARDRASATYTGALESRTGYATQVAGLRELTETTEKSLRDLDSRYQEALMANDANTAAQVASLRMEKLKFQQEQEQNFFTNVMSVANLQQSAIDSMMQNEQFWQSKEQQDRQFAMEMAQSTYQFQQNLGLQYKELDLQEQELGLQRERNQISREELALRKSEIDKEKTTTTLKSIVFDRMARFVKEGGKLDEKDAIQWQEEMVASLGPSFPMLAEMEPEVVATFINEALIEVGNEVAAGRLSGPTASAAASQRNTGILPSIGREFANDFSSGMDWWSRLLWKGQ